LQLKKDKGEEMVKLSLLYFMFYFTLGSSVLYFSSLFDAIGISGKVSGLIFGAGSLIAMVSQPLLGMLADKSRKNRDILVVLVLIISGISMILYFTQSLLMATFVFFKSARV
jgi:PPP family 3-phenylpropionic acid transporter